jgi:pyruvate kinase
MVTNQEITEPHASGRELGLAEESASKTSDMREIIPNFLISAPPMRPGLSSMDEKTGLKSSFPTQTQEAASACFPRKTKIIATLGPATENPEILRALLEAGVSVFRINMSHSRHDTAARLIYAVRAISTKLNRKISLLLDTQGPAIRTGDLPTKLDLKAGDMLTLAVRGHKPEEVFSVDTNCDDLVKDIEVGDVVLVDNGVIQMAVKEKSEFLLRCEVFTPGSLGSRRRINLPGVRVNQPAITEKDWDDIRFGVESNVDWIALSFVREAADVWQLRKFLAAQKKNNVNIIAKIDDQSALGNLDQIIQVADGITVARGDLGIECPYEEMPIIQRRIVKKCVAARKPVIVATHLLESMIQNPLPTRAEITDVANAIYEQADAIMLSGETSVGRYSVHCVQVLNRVARRVEFSGNIGFQKQITLASERDNLIASAIHLADQTKADGIAVFTRQGHLASLCAALRPRWSPVFAFTPDARLARRLRLRYALQPVVLPFSEQPKDTIHAAEKVLLERKFLAPGAKVVFITDILDQGQRISSVQVRMLAETQQPGA